MKRGKDLKTIVTLLLVTLVIAPWLAVVAGAKETTFHPVLKTSFLVPSQFRPLYFDFDGDNWVDRADLLSNGQHKCISLSLSGSWTRVLYFESEETDRGRLLCGDLDNDNDEDLLWISSENRSPAYWIGDGRGNFARVQDFQPDARKLSALINQDTQSGSSAIQQIVVQTQAILPSESFGWTPVRQLELSASAIAAVPYSAPRRAMPSGIIVFWTRGPPLELS